MSEIIFSVIVTAYNQPQEIKRAVESVLNQTEKCFEVIVVDDCSTDETPKILNSLADSNPCVKIIRHEKNSSSHVARCTGVENADGQYVIFLDGDDYLFPDALEKLLTQVVEPLHDDFDVCEYSYMCQPSGEVITPAVFDFTKTRIEYYQRLDATVTIWNKLYRTQVVRNAFSNMEKAYIRCGDDTYESICIAYFTRKFIQKNILVTNYVLGMGVSLRKNTFVSNQKNCESFKISMKCISTFFEKYPYIYSSKICDCIEQKFFDWSCSVMRNNTENADVVKSLLLLPRYFNLSLIEDSFKTDFLFMLRIRKIKHFIKKMFKI